MNKTITAAVRAVNANPTDTTAVTALRDLAVPKFKTVYGKVQSAVKSVNRHIGEGKGTPNRAKLAEAIGLRDTGMIADYTTIASIIGMPEMQTAVLTLTQVVNDLDAMRTARSYTHMSFLPDFLTDAERAEKKVTEAKIYLANIVRGVNRAVVSVNRHITACDFGPNTFKIAKAIGYAADVDALNAEFKALPNAAVTYQTEIALCAIVTATIGALKSSVSVGNTLPVAIIPDYDPFPACESGECEECADGEEECDEVVG